jgi:phosphatidylinositol glycan class Q protein
LALVNHFPLFSLMLSVKDPWRIPGIQLPIAFRFFFSLFKILYIGGIIFVSTRLRPQSGMGSDASLIIEVHVETSFLLPDHFINSMKFFYKNQPVPLSLLFSKYG